MASDIGLVSDFDFHPDEPYVREFRFSPGDVLRMDDAAFACEAESNGVVLRHYAFADEWFKVNVTFDRAGALVETPALTEFRSPVPPFAFNCDIATPMLRRGSAVHAVDLFLDVLVRADGQTHEVIDEDEFDAAVRSGLVSAGEADSARRGLDRLLGLIERNELLAFLERICPVGPSTAGSALPMRRTPIIDVPLIRPGHRPTWF